MLQLTERESGLMQALQTLTRRIESLESDLGKEVIAHANTKFLFEESKTMVDFLTEESQGLESSLNQTRQNFEGLQADLTEKTLGYNALETRLNRYEPNQLHDITMLAIEKEETLSFPDFEGDNHLPN